MVSVAFCYWYIERHVAERHYAERHYAERHWAEGYYPACSCA